MKQLETCTQVCAALFLALAVFVFFYMAIATHDCAFQKAQRGHGKISAFAQCSYQHLTSNPQ